MVFGTENLLVPTFAATVTCAEGYSGSISTAPCTSAGPYTISGTCSGATPVMVMLKVLLTGW